MKKIYGSARYTFSTEFTKEEDARISEIAEEFFETEEDFEQIPMSAITYEIVHDRYPGSLSMIKYGTEIVGFTFLLPANKAIMNDFVSSLITEREPFQQVIRQVTMENFDTIYLAAALIQPAHRGKGLATSSFIEQVNEFVNEKHVDLFCWTTTENGRYLVNGISKKMRCIIRDKSSQ